MKTLKIKNYTVQLDTEDWVRLCRFSWQVKTQPPGMPTYFYTRKTLTHNGVKKRYTIYLHRAIMCPPYGLDLLTSEEVHHKDGNMNHQKEFLEVISRAAHNGITHYPKKPNDDVPI